MIGPKEGRPLNWVAAAEPPPLPYGRWLGNGWEILETYPELPPEPVPPLVANPLGFRMALITDPALLPIYTAVNTIAMSNLAVSHAFLLFNESLWNEPFLIQACQAALNLLASVYSFSEADREVLSTAFGQFSLDLHFNAPD